MKIRRVVTGRNSAGKSVVISDGPSPQEMVLQHTPGFVSSPQWKIEGTPELGGVDLQDPMNATGTMIMPAGGSSFWVITFPPDSVFMSSQWNPAVAGPELTEASPGIAERMESDSPGMHQTPTVDYVTVVKGRLILELDDGKTVELNAGDTVVQQGARHAWRNPTDEPATISVVLLGAMI
ncbi:cupin domain-containing protein [Mesorhizobium australafricanum]|uniref:Cupin domain-containing protein n=1 Tax=Mesorhizobium australafricanum TaxID=3072311 RepID=A0ABU4WZ35_9HYPH|nr:cupin domain-containing protein [Mesorhizobium sp. VK3E]MDX8440255.1 cupin domain-containing protein [Mesorhizobium sp. VK3E]